MDPFRLTVLKALTAALEEITIANGYQFDLAGVVYRGRLVLTEEDGLPCVTINEPPQMPEDMASPEGSPDSKVNLTVLIQGFVQDDRTHPTDPAYRLLADVQKRLAVERSKTPPGRPQSRGFDILGFGERIMSLSVGQGVVRPPDAVVSDNAFFWLPVTLTFVEDRDDPFA